MDSRLGTHTVIFLSTVCALFNFHLQQPCRIADYAVHPQHPVEVRPGDPAGGAAQPDDVAGVNLLPLFHPDLRQVHVSGKNIGAVIDEHRITAEEKILGQHYSAAVAEVDWRSGSACDVGTPMKGPLLAVEYPADPEG